MSPQEILGLIAEAAGTKVSRRGHARQAFLLSTYQCFSCFPPNVCIFLSSNFGSVTNLPIPNCLHDLRQTGDLNSGYDGHALDNYCLSCTATVNLTCMTKNDPVVDVRGQERGCAKDHREEAGQG
jgi:hypothetical protein